MKPLWPEPLTYFYMSRSAPCPYLPGRTEQMVFTDLSKATSPAWLHDTLSRNGFRRSQVIAYKPICTGCQACVPVRIAVTDFEPSRSLKRIQRRNGAMDVRMMAATASEEHYALFRKYITTRHAEGGMAQMSIDDYAAMVQDSPIPSRLIEFRLADGRLYGVCLTDVLDDGLSLVYSFFDPALYRASPGIYMILWHVQEARRQCLPFVYMGYWIENSRKMAYKIRFDAVETFGDDGWRRLDNR